MMAVLMCLTSCVVRYSKTESNVKKTVNTDSFERIEVQGSRSVYYEQGDSVSVRLEGPEEELQLIEVGVVGNVLKVRAKDGGFNLRRFGNKGSNEVRVYVTSPDLIGVEVMGSGRFDCSSPLDTDVLDLALRGSGDIRFASIICDRIHAEVAGSGDIKLGEVQTQQASLGLVGSGDLDARLRQVPKTDISLTGSGDVEVVFIDCGSANCQLAGSGDIELSGTLKELTKTQSGSGSIKLRRLKRDD